MTRLIAAVIASIAVFVGCSGAVGGGNSVSETPAVPTKPSSEPADTPPPSAPDSQPPSSPNPPPTVSGSGGGSGSSPRSPSVVGHVVFAISAGTVEGRSSNRMANAVFLPAVPGTRLGATVAPVDVPASFPDGFTYDRSKRRSSRWSVVKEVPVITSGFLHGGGYVGVSYRISSSEDNEWALTGGVGFINPVLRYKVGSVRIVVYSNPEVGADQLGGMPHRGNSHRTPSVDESSLICKTTQSEHANSGWDGNNEYHTPTITVTGGSTEAKVTTTLTNGVVTGAAVKSGGSGFTNGTGRTLAHTWNRFWGESQRGSGAAFTFDVTGGAVTGVSVTSGGTGYRKPCLAPASGSIPAAEQGESDEPSYFDAAFMRANLREGLGSNILYVRLVLISP